MNDSTNNSTPVIAVFFQDPDPYGYPFNEQDYMEAYRQLDALLTERGAQMVVVRDQDSYLGNGEFKRGWMISSDPFEEVENVQADLIFDRKPFEHDGTVPIFNHPEIHQLCTDKATTYATFPDFSPVSFTATTNQEVREDLAKIESKMVVIKPVDGAEGKDVTIIDKSEAEDYQPKQPVIVQEFLDTSAGIPGIVDGLHDLRVTVLNGELVYSYVRTPPKGSFAANVAQGGTFRTIDLALLPEEVVEIVKSIDQSLAHIDNRLFCVDFGVTPRGPKIIEMNSRVGLLPDKDGDVYKIYKQKLADVLINCL